MPRYDFFISHHQADSGNQASLLARELGNRGYSTFLDIDTPQVGNLRQLTRDALKESEGVVVLVGPNFADRLQNDRDWVRVELEAAHEAGKKVLPVLLEDINADAIISRLPTSLHWFGGQRFERFSRVDLDSVAERVVSAFGARRPAARGGPGTGYLVLMIALSLLLGMAFLDNQKKESALELQRLRLDSERGRAEALEREVDRLKSEAQRR